MPPACIGARWATTAADAHLAGANVARCRKNRSEGGNAAALANGGQAAHPSLEAKLWAAADKLPATSNPDFPNSLNRTSIALSPPVRTHP